MSHHHSHKICSNCGTEVQESFCSKCGQKYLDHKETLGHLFLHFFEYITHFDSRFHKSITPLFFKPRFLTNEYNAGKRTMYLNPVRMYFFVSLIYFLSFFLYSLGCVINAVNNELLSRSDFPKNVTKE